MKTELIWIRWAALVAGVVLGAAPGWAQPAGGAAPVAGAAPDGPAAAAGDEPAVNDDEDKAWSRGVPPESRKAARALFLEGNRLFRIPLYGRAAEQYEAAIAKWPHPAFYFNLGLARLNLGNDVAAYESLERAIAHGEGPLRAEQLAEAQRQLQHVRRRIGRIRVTCRTPGAEVTLDGVTLFVGPGSFEGWVTAKPHELTAKRAGYLSEAKRIAVSPEGVQGVELTLMTLGEATDASRRWAAWKPWAVVAAGGAIAAAGGGLHAMAVRGFDDYDAAFLRLPCAAEPDRKAPGCSAEQVSDLDDRLARARRQQSIAVGAYVAGGSLIAAGVVLLYLNRPRLSERQAARSVAVEPAISEGMIGLAVRVSH